jgi:hypothetical protein
VNSQGKHALLSMVLLRPIPVRSKKASLPAAKNGCPSGRKCNILCAHQSFAKTVVEIDSRMAAKRQSLAEARHISIDELLATYVPDLNGKNRTKTDSDKEQTQAFDDWVAGFSRAASRLSDEAIGRRSIYGNR